MQHPLLLATSHLRSRTSYQQRPDERWAVSLYHILASTHVFSFIAHHVRHRARKEDREQLKDDERRCKHEA